MKIDLSQFRETYLQECAEHVATLESGLLALREAPDDEETLNAIFRSAHSIKGGAGSFGFDSLMHFTHAMENLLDRLRSNEISVTDDAIDVLLGSVDVLRFLLQSAPESPLPDDAPQLLQRIELLTDLNCESGADSQNVASSSETIPAKDDILQTRMYRIEFRPDREMFSSGTNPIVLLRNLAAMGTVSVAHLHTDNLPSLAELDSSQCYLAWTVEMASASSKEELCEVFEFVEHLAEIKIQSLDEEPDTVLKDSKSPSGQKPNTKEESSGSAGAKAEVKGAVSASAINASSSIRVSTDKIDRLIDLVGELVIAHGMTAQMVDKFTPECLPKLREAVATMERNTRELHERVMAVRMLPVGTLFRRYQRTVYDIAHSTGKQIDLELMGEETEIDKSMLELLGDPLTHLVRNAADHGIEIPEVRMASGKTAEGKIELRAFHRSGRVVIEVVDDGAGLDLEKIRAKAIERGLLSEQTQLSDEQLRMMIFEPGFSTNDVISDISGRGVGMDVVKQNVQQLNGSVSVSSVRSKGSTVTIELPLTLAILEGLLIRVADRKLVLPLLSVVETVSPKSGQLQKVAEQGEVVVIRDQPIPVLRLRHFLGNTGISGTSRNVNSEENPRDLIVVVETGRKKIGLMIDELLGQQQVVVKSLEKNLRKVDGLMGATILADGCVAPILDVASIAKLNLYALQAENFSLPQSASCVSSAVMTTIKNEGESSHALV